MGAIFNATTLKDAAGISYNLAMQWHAPLTPAMAVAKINTDNRLAQWIAQLGHESEGFARTEENLNYSAEALRAKYPAYFSDELAQRLGRTDDHKADPVGIANTMYGGRMGNLVAPSNDGYDNRGFGLIQVTGANNHKAFRAWLLTKGYSTAFVSRLKPSDLAKPDLAAMSAAWFWETNNLNKWADLGDVDACSRVINLGSATSKKKPNGLEDRRAKFTLARSVVTGRK